MTTKTTTQILDSAGYYSILNRYDPLMDAAFDAPFNPSASATEVLVQTFDTIVEQEYKSIETASDISTYSKSSIPEVESLVQPVDSAFLIKAEKSVEPSRNLLIDEYQALFEQDQPVGFVLDQAVDLSVEVNNFSHASISSQTQNDESNVAESVIAALQATGLA